MIKKKIYSPSRGIEPKDSILFLSHGTLENNLVPILNDGYLRPAKDLNKDTTWEGSDKNYVYLTLHCSMNMGWWEVRKTGGSMGLSVRFILKKSILKDMSPEINSSWAYGNKSDRLTFNNLKELITAYKVFGKQHLCEHAEVLVSKPIPLEKYLLAIIDIPENMLPKIPLKFQKYIYTISGFANVFGSGFYPRVMKIRDEFDQIARESNSIQLLKACKKIGIQPLIISVISTEPSYRLTTINRPALTIPYMPIIFKVDVELFKKIFPEEAKDKDIDHSLILKYAKKYPFSIDSYYLVFS